MNPLRLGGSLVRVEVRSLRDLALVATLHQFTFLLWHVRNKEWAVERGDWFLIFGRIRIVALPATFLRFSGRDAVSGRLLQVLTILDRAELVLQVLHKALKLLRVLEVRRSRWKYIFKIVL